MLVRGIITTLKTDKNVARFNQMLHKSYQDVQAYCKSLNQRLMFNEADSVHFRLSREQKQEDSHEPVNYTHITIIDYDRGIFSFY